METKFRKVMIFLLACVMIFSITPTLFAANAGQPVELLKNGDFETMDPDGKSNTWLIECWQYDAVVGITNQKVRSGKYAGFIQFEKSNDARFVQTVPVEPGTVYRFSGWISTQGVSLKKLGANLCVMGQFIRSSGVNGDSDWQYQEVIFRTCDDQTAVNLGARLGFWSETVKGLAFFDDLKLEKITDPAIPFQQLSVNDKPTPPPATPAERPEIKQFKIPEPKTVVTGIAKYLGYTTWCLLFYLVLLIFGLYLRPKQIDGSMLGEDKYNALIARLPLFFMVAAAINFLIRIPLFGAVPIENDMAAYKSWILRMLELGPGQFYVSGINCDYPPVPLYLLWLIGGIAKAFGIMDQAVLYNSLIKLPALFCDIATAWLIFKLLRNKRPVLSLILSVVYMFLPAVVYLSSYWGQVDSYYAFLMMLSFYFIVKKKPEIAVIFTVLSFFTKTQTLAFIPLLLFYLFYQYDWKRCLRVIGIAVGTGILILLPYTIGGWIFEFYKYQRNIYPFATMNAANFLVLLNGNYTNVGTKIFLGLNYYVLGILLFLAAVIWICYFYSMKKTKASLAAAFFMAAFAFFMFFPLMHERYLYPAMAFLFLTVGYYKDKKIFYGAILLSLSYLFNLHFVVLKLQESIEDGDFHRIMYILSLVNTGLFIYYISVFQMQLRGDGRKLRQFFNRYTQKFRTALDDKLKAKPFKMTKRDWLILGILVIIYSIHIFFRLGTTNTPQTGLNFPDPQSAIEVVLEKPSNITTMVIYDAEDSGQLLVEKLVNGVWTYGVTYKSEKYYVLDRISLLAEGVSRLRFTPQSAAGRINEIAFLDAQNNLIPVKSVIHLVDNNEEPASATPLFDEQEKMLVKPSFLNSTYFDEIYHGRTAYEFVIKSPSVYETTHPHLGKDILSLGILIFGMNPFGMRVMHAVMGILLMILLFFMGRQVLATRFGAFTVMILGMLDFMPFVQSRYSTIDTTSVFFIGLTFLFTFKYVRKQEESPGLKGSIGLIALIAFFFGLAASVKWTGVYSIAGVALCFAVVKARQFLKYREERAQTIAALKSKVTGKSGAAKNREINKELEQLSHRFWKKNFWPTVLACILLFGLISPLTYYLTYIPYLNTRGIGLTDTFSRVAFNEVKQNQISMYDYHSRLTSGHPFACSWWGWPFNFRPLSMYPDGNRTIPVKPGYKASITSLGNPVIWYLGVIAILMLIYQLLKNRRLSMMHFVLIAYFVEYLPWIMVTRVTFIYHYYACLLLALVCVAFILEQFWRSGPSGKKVVYTVGVLSLIFLIMFYPVLAGIEVSEKYITFLRFFPHSWSF